MFDHVSFHYVFFTLLDCRDASKNVRGNDIVLFAFDVTITISMSYACVWGR